MVGGVIWKYAFNHGEQAFASALGVVLFFAYIVGNTMHNLDRQGIASGFGFLTKAAGFGISQTLVDYSEVSPNARVFWVGLLNTILVAALGVTLAFNSIGWKAQNFLFNAVGVTANLAQVILK